MLVLQIIGSSIIFLNHFLLRDFPPEPVFAVFLFSLIIISSGYVFSSAKIRFPVAAVKITLCIIMIRYTFLPVFLLPAICLEATEFLPEKKGISTVIATYAVALAFFVFLLPQNMALYFLGFWAITVFISFLMRKHNTSIKKLVIRLNLLKNEIFEAETKNSNLEKTNAGQELLIKFEERDRIAQKLHDELGHTITGSIMQLEAAALLFPDDPDRVKDIISKVSRTLKEGLSAIRSSLKAIKPAPSLLGLQKIRGLLADFQSSYGKTTNLIIEGNLQTISTRLWQLVENNLTEALTNMLRHSNGHCFTCRLCVLNGMYKFEFCDDGTAGSIVRMGMGLEGMEKRTGEAGGTLIIDTSAGFSVIMLFKKGEND